MRTLLDLLAPPACASCGTAVPIGLGVLCGACRARVPRLVDPCPRCALPSPCGGRCRRRPLAWDRVWAVAAHAGPARDLVHALKYRGESRVADAIAAQVAAAAPAGVLARPAVVVPVPADPGRRRARGLDPAALLASAIAGRTRLPCRRVLVAGRRPGKQEGASRAVRLARGDAADVRARRPAPGRVVLVDDVHTTGATLARAACALRAAGAQEVVAVTYTRAL